MSQACVNIAAHANLAKSHRKKVGGRRGKHESSRTVIASFAIAKRSNLGRGCTGLGDRFIAGAFRDDRGEFGIQHQPNVFASLQSRRGKLESSQNVIASLQSRRGNLWRGCTEPGDRFIAGTFRDDKRKKCHPRGGCQPDEGSFTDRVMTIKEFKNSQPLVLEDSSHPLKNDTCFRCLCHPRGSLLPKDLPRIAPAQKVIASLQSRRGKLESSQNVIASLQSRRGNLRVRKIIQIRQNHE